MRRLPYRFLSALLATGLALALAADTPAPGQKAPPFPEVKQPFPVPVVTTPPAPPVHEDLLRWSGLDADGAALVAFLRRRAAPETDPGRLAAVVTRLDGDPASARAACAGVLAAGPAVVPLLRQAARDPDHPGAALAGRCLRVLEQDPGALASAVVRLVAKRRPAGAVPALLAFLPHADDAGVLEEVRQALAALAYSAGRPDAALLDALDDPLPLRRAAAASALGEGPVPPADRLRKLLADRVPSVRLRAALALAAADDPDAVSALVALLADLPPDLARLAESVFLEVAADQAPRVELGTDAEGRRRCRDAWAAWWKSSEGAALLDELRRRTPTEQKRLRGAQLIARLGDDDFSVREQATREIRDLGSVVVPLLRQALRHPDVEVRQRVETLLGELGSETVSPLSPALPRLIALRKPAGAAAAVLDFLPWAEDEATAADLRRALASLAAPRGKADPAVVRALRDPSPVRRAAAAEALCRSGAAEHFRDVRKLLSDPDPAVRLAAATGLAGAGRRDAVPAVIDALADMPAPLAGQAEEFLLTLAGDQPPPGLAAGDDARRRRDAWAAWWAARGGRVELTARPPVRGEGRGGTVLVQPQGNQVVCLGTDGKERWKLSGLLGPQDAQVLGPNRVLVAEHNGQRVTERNLRGDVLWQKPTPTSWPVSVQRLRNGHTFIACRNRLLEVDREGHELYAIPRPAHDVIEARKTRDGGIVCVSNRRSVSRLDTTGKELRTFGLPAVGNMGAEVLPDGHVLVCVPWTAKVSEYDGDGKVVWEVSMPQALAAWRLGGGRALVAQQVWPARVVEVDRTGKVLSEVPTGQYTWRVRR
jgi:HEAT repeat protein